jgi:hypothetical protein
MSFADHTAIYAENPKESTKATRIVKCSHACSPVTWEAQRGGHLSPGVQDQPGDHSETPI